MRNDIRVTTQLPTGWLAVAIILTCGAIFVGIFNGLLGSYFDALVYGMLGLIIFTSISMKMAVAEDADWLPSMVAAGFLAKMAFATVRYLVLVYFYNGSGDAVGYHGSGHRTVEVWRSFEVPPEMGLGTAFLDGVTGLLYVPYAPTMFGGFILFSVLAFGGQLLMYAAFRRAGEPRFWKWYAIVLFFVPAITYWPASIGKESLIFLGLGLAAYGASVLLDSGRWSALLPLIAGLSLIGAIRAHIAALVIGSLAAAFAISKTTAGKMPSGRKFVLTTLIVGVSLVGVVFTAQSFNIDLDESAAADLDEFVGTVEDNTSKGGSEVSGGMVTNPLDFPEATLKVLFRPLPNEAHNIPAMASALESTLMLLIVLWRSPRIISNLRYIRSQPYVLMCLVMTIGFIIMFSSFLNLGLLARQRSQILPFFAVVIIQLGFSKFKKDTPPPLVPMNPTAPIDSRV